MLSSCSVSYLTFKLNHGFYEVISLFTIFQYANKVIDDANIYDTVSRELRGSLILKKTVVRLNFSTIFKV